MITLSSADKALKTYYLDVIAQQLNNEVNPFVAMLEKTSSNVWGKEVRKLVHYGLSAGIGAAAETADLPESDSCSYQQLILPLKNLYGHISISDKALRASETSAGAFVNLLEAEMENLLNTAKFHFSRMIFGDGTGNLTTLLANEGNVLAVDYNERLAEGMCVDIVRPSTGAVVISGRHIVNFDSSQTVVTLDGADIEDETVEEGDIIVLHGSYKNELTGLGAIFDTTNVTSLYGLSRSTNKWLNPVTTSASAITLTDSFFQEVIDNAEMHSGGRINYITCHPRSKRAYQDYMMTSRTNINVSELAGGYKAITFNGIPIVADKFCKDATMYLLNTDDFHIYQLCDWRWMEDDAGRVLQQVPGKAVYGATLVKYAELLCERPCAQASITSLY